MSFFTFLIICLICFIFRKQVKSATELVQQELDLYALSVHKDKITKVHQHLDEIKELEKQGVDPLSVNQAWDILKMQSEVLSIKLQKQQEEAIKRLQSSTSKSKNFGLGKDYFK